MTKNSIFSNLFDSKRITVNRLLIFSEVVVSALGLLDKTLFADIILEMTDSINALSAEIGDVDTNLTTQKSNTKAVTKFRKGFAKYMSENEPFIAKILGGRASDGYLAFYPFGITEYSAATNTTMLTLTKRVLKAAIKYADVLGAVYTEELESFSPDFLKIYSSQQSQIGTVKGDRKERSVAGLALGVTLMKAVHTVGVHYPANEAAGKQIFPLAMLYAKANVIKKEIEGSLLVMESKSVLNQSLIPRITVTVTNLSLNSDANVWLSPTTDGKPTADAKVVKANSATTFKASDLGDLKNTFLMIGNASEVNPLSFKIEVSGFKKEKKPAGASVKNLAKKKEEPKDNMMVANG